MNGFEMKSYNLIFRIVVLIGIVGFTIKDSKDIFSISVYTIVSLILSLMQGIIKDKYKGIVFVFLIIWNLIFYVSGMEISSVFLTIILIEEVIKKVKILIPTIILVVFFIMANYQKNFIGFYIYTNVLALFFTYLSYTNNKKIKDLESLLDKNIKKNNRLKERIKNEGDFYKQSIYSVKLEERNELSRRMHDNVGHVIAASLMRLEAAQIVLKSDRVKGEEMIKETAENLRNGMEDIRKTIHDISPKSEEIGINKIKLLLEEKLKSLKIEYLVTNVGNIETISPKEWAVIYDGIKELSTNSIKYSNCENIYINIEVLNKLVKVTFKDDGIGNKKIIKGYGLTKLEESILKLGGNLIVDGRDGFSVIMIFYK